MFRTASGVGGKSGWRQILFYLRITKNIKVAKKFPPVADPVCSQFPLTLCATPNIW